MQLEDLKFETEAAAQSFINRMEERIKEEQDEKFHITDKEKADWVVAKITTIVDEIDRLKKQHETRIKNLERQQKFFEMRFGAELQGFVKANLPRNRKSLDLPHGRAGFRKSQETIEVIDQELNIEWCKENVPDAVRKREYTTKTEQLEHFKKTGEIPKGCKYKPSEDKFYIR